LKLSTLIIISSISIVSISLLVPSYLALTGFSEEFEKTVTSDIEISITNAMDKIDRIMNGRIIDIKFLSSNKNHNLVGDHQNINDKIGYLRDYEILSQMYTSMSIYDSDGIKIGDTRNLKIGIDQSKEGFFMEAIKGKIYHDEVPILSKSLGVPIIHFSGPMYDNNDNINGVLVLSFSLSKISDILDQDAIYSKPIDVFLLSQYGFIIYANHPNEGFLGEVFELSIMQNFLQSTDNQISFIEFNEEENQEELFSIAKQRGFHQYEGDNWYLIFDVPTVILFEERDIAISTFIILAGIILSMSIVASFVIATRISNPIRKLEKEMKKVSKSNFKINHISGGGQEIESMSKSFEKMVSDIQKGEVQIKNQLKELKKIDEQKDEFAAMISHELKTPFVPIQLYTEMLLDGLLGTMNEKQKKALTSIHNNLMTLSALIDDVLDITKLELGRFTLDKKQIDVNDLLTKMLT